MRLSCVIAHFEVHISPSTLSLIGAVGTAGRAAIYTPTDIGVPNNGILVISEYNKEQWVCATVDLNAVDTVRRKNQIVQNRDWPSSSIAVNVHKNIENLTPWPMPVSPASYYEITKVLVIAT